METMDTGPRPSHALRVALVEDHSLVRDGIARLLDDAGMTVVWEGDSVAELVESKVSAEVVVLDFDLNGHRITEADIDRIQRLGARILLCSAIVNDATLAPLIRTGVVGAVSKSAGYQELLQAVRAIAAGGTWLSPSLLLRVANHDEKFALSAQQTEVLRLYASGMKLATVARHLHISPNTVSYHLRMIRQKSDKTGSRVTTQRDMLRLAQELGIEADGPASTEKC